MLGAEVIATDDAHVGWVQFGIDEDFHGDEECGIMVWSRVESRLS
jgi:hypothetical protein